MKTFVKTEFLSHKNHNPSCDILCGYIDANSFITYGIYVKECNGIKKGSEFMEYYSGENYVPESKKKSTSRMFKVYEGQEIPKKYKESLLALKSMYEAEEKTIYLLSISRESGADLSKIVLREDDEDNDFDEFEDYEKNVCEDLIAEVEQGWGNAIILEEGELDYIIDKIKELREEE